MTLKLDMSVAAFSGFLLEAYGIEETGEHVHRAAGEGGGAQRRNSVGRLLQVVGSRHV